MVAGLWRLRSSALGALLGAPRTLQALAKDRALPKALAKGHGPDDEPRIATGFHNHCPSRNFDGRSGCNSTGIVYVFLTSYGLLNFSAGLEGMITNPSWNPNLGRGTHFNNRWISLSQLSCF